MTWFGIVLLILYAFNFCVCVIRASEGGHSYSMSAPTLAFVAFVQLLLILGILLVGTGAVA